MFVSVDDPISGSLLERIHAADGIVDTTVVELPPR